MRNEMVNGEMLVFDITTEILRQELGVKLLHCGGIQRRIKRLKDSINYNDTK